jgi:hypothetical protein
MAASLVGQIMAQISIFAGNATSASGLATGVKGTTTSTLTWLKDRARDIQARFRYTIMLIKFSLVSAALSQIDGFVGSAFCIVNEATFLHVYEAFADGLIPMLEWVFVKAFDPTMPCFLYWVIYLLLFALWWAIRLILMIFKAEFVEDSIFCVLRSIDEIDLTAGMMYMTKFTPNVIDNCFTTPDLDSLTMFRFSKCGFDGVEDMGYPIGQGVLEQWPENNNPKC